jgi:hypothetical protein
VGGVGGLPNRSPLTNQPAKDANDNRFENTLFNLRIGIESSAKGGIENVFKIKSSRPRKINGVLNS